MLFTEEELYSINPLDILDECMYLGYDESLIDPRTIPITENSRLGYNIVRFDDVDTLAESYGIDYIDAMYSIAESSDIDPDDLAVSVPEEDIIAYPELVNELANIVIEPLSENDIEYRFVMECVDAYLESGDDGFLEYIAEAAPHYDKNMQMSGKTTGGWDFSRSSDADLDQWEATQRSIHKSAMDWLNTHDKSHPDYKSAQQRANTAARDLGRLQDERERRAAKRSARAGNKPIAVPGLNERLARMKGAKTGERYSVTGGDPSVPVKGQPPETVVAGGDTTATATGGGTSGGGQGGSGGGGASVQSSWWSRTKGRLANAFGSSGRESDYNIAKAWKQFKGKGRLTSDNLKTLGMDTEYNQAMSNVGKGSGFLDSRFDRVTRNRMAAGAGAAALAGAGIAGYLAYKKYRNAPKSVIGKRIAALRGVYRNFMQQANKNPQKAGMLKSIAAKILGVIDKLMGYLQRAAG